MLAPNPRNRSTTSIPCPPASNQRAACNGHTSGGSTLDADPPAQGPE